MGRLSLMLSCSWRTRQSQWARAHTTRPAWWPLLVHMDGQPRGPSPAGPDTSPASHDVWSLWLRRQVSVLAVSHLHPSFALSGRSPGFSVSLSWFLSLCPWALFFGPHPQGLLGCCRAQAAPPPGLVALSP